MDFSACRTECMEDTMQLGQSGPIHCALDVTVITWSTRRADAKYEIGSHYHFRI